MSRSGFLDVPDSFISITPHTVYSIVVLLGDSHESAEDMSAVFYDTGEVCKFGGKRYPLKRSFQVTLNTGEKLRSDGHFTIVGKYHMHYIFAPYDVTE